MSLTLAAGSAQNPSTNVLAVTLPGGAAAGDLVIITVGARWDFTATPSGWSVADANDGSFFNGRTVYKVLTSGDVSTGSATFNFGGVSNLAATAVLITGGSAAPTVTVRSSQRWGGGGSALLAAQPSNSFSAASGSLMVYAGINDSSTAMTVSRGSQAGSANTTSLIIGHANSEVLGSPLSSVTATFNSGSATSAYYVVVEVSDSDAVVSPPAATATAAAVVPAVSASRVVLPPAATATASALPPTIGAGGNATVSPPAATATAAALAPTITQTIPAGTDTSNSLNGRRRRARASVVVTRPAAASPSRAAVKYDKSVPYPPPTLVNGRPT